MTRFRPFVVVPFFLVSCGSARSAPPSAPTVVATPASPPPSPPSAARATEVLMINGGGNATLNYRSHLLHLENLHRLLVGSGVPDGHISVLASDGEDPKPDLAARETASEAEVFRLEGTRLERALSPRTALVDSKIQGVTLEPATKGSVIAWFEKASKRLHAGDTLLVYVTDHGTRRSTDPSENRITLWGNDEWISVREMSELVAKLDPGVRVVSLMSQCFSGGFAGLSAARLTEGEPSGNVCGYFSSTAERPAYGCYAENRGKDDVGHSFEFTRALGRSGRFRDAHAAVLANDTTPDVPLRTSDVYLQALLQADADARKVSFVARVDELLHEAFQDAGRFEAETRLLDRIARLGGSFSPRSLSELDEFAKRLPDIDGQLATIARAFEGSLADVNATTLTQFLAARPDWNERLADPALGKLDEHTAPMLTKELLSDLVPFTGKDSALAERLAALHTRGDAAEAASYRMEVRLAVVLRMRVVLASIAGRVLVERSGTKAQKAALSGLTACEDFTLPAPTRPAEAEPAPPAPYAAFDDEVKTIEATLPGWMGISFKDPSDAVRAKSHLPNGASVVSLVYPDSPAKAAGLEVGDVVMGPPGAPFSTKNQIRAWTMLSPVGKPGALEILRDGKRRVVSVVPAPYPVKWPALPGPVQVGTVAPKVELRGYRGAVADQLRKKHVLYFWATWCGPCKAALPELLAFEKATHTPVIAVTDEDSGVLDGFVKKFTSPFPNAIATDELRRAFVAYGVSGTPTFVLVDEHGKVLAQQVGYDARAGLGFPGWTWQARPNATGAPTPTPPSPAGKP